MAPLSSDVISKVGTLTLRVIISSRMMTAASES
jgi:hypothetical protein